jgi:ATP-dependent DNA ligase
VPVRYREQQPTFIPPMLLSSGALPSGDGWTFEVKWDGSRAQLRYDGRSVSLRTRNGRECAADFPSWRGSPTCWASVGSRSTVSRSASGGMADRTSADSLANAGQRGGRTERGFRRKGRGTRTGGLVAKRLGSTYLPGRRCTAWIKRKLRREELLAVTGVRRNRDGHVDAIFVARHHADGSFADAGAIKLGSTVSLSSASRPASPRRPASRRGSVAWYPAEVSVVASLHGVADGPVRDAVLREVPDGAVASM